MSVASLLDAGFTEIIGKARQEFADQQVQQARPITINVNFSGGGSALSTGKPCIARIPVPCTIQSVEIYAGNETGAPVVVTTAIVDLWTTTIDTFSLGGQSPLNNIGAKVSLAGASSAVADLTGWTLNLEATDRLVGRIATWSGTATWLAVLISVLPTLVPQGTLGILDDSGNAVLDANGNPVQYRI